MKTLNIGKEKHIPGIICIKRKQNKKSTTKEVFRWGSSKY